MVEVEVLAERLAFPEGPVAMDDGSVLLVEIMGGTLKRVWGGGRMETIATLGGGPNGAQLGPDGAVYVCNNGGLNAAGTGHATGAGAEGRIERVDLATGKVERLYERCGEWPLSAPNDLVFDSAGGLWFTDMGKTLERETARAGVYYASADGSLIVEAHFGGVAYNGIGLSPEEKTLYLSDTLTGRLYSFALSAPGQLAGRRKFVAAVPGDVMLDSLAVTESGAVCVATIHPGGISVVRPGGDVEGVPMPDDIVTNIAFGGPDMRTAFITLAGRGQLVRASWPEPGLRLNFAA